jgi:hypothetical protein
VPLPWTGLPAKRGKMRQRCRHQTGRQGGRQANMHALMPAGRQANMHAFAGGQANMPAFMQAVMQVYGWRFRW